MRCVALGDGHGREGVLKSVGQKAPDSKPTLEVNAEHALLV